MTSAVQSAQRALLLLLLSLLASTPCLSQAKPKITTTAVPAGSVGTPYSQALSATGGTLPYSWSLSGGALPAGVTLSAAGSLSGTPGGNGAFPFTAKVQDAGGNTATQALTLTINSSPAITTASLPNGTAGSPYSTTLAASGAVSPVAWTVSVGALPAGLTLAAATGVIGGTPSTQGTSSFTVKLTDSAGGSTTRALSLTINPDPPAISTTSLPSGTVGTLYSRTLAASGGTLPYAWSVSVGSLPAGLTLSTAGLISGTPGAAGSSSFTVKVVDGASASSTAPLSLTINPAALVITTSSLPAGTANTAYSQTLAAAGGTPPYGWSLTTGSLPTGLTLSPAGTISGTPGATGTSTFTVKVTDNASASTTASLSLTINPAALVITTSSLPAGTANTAYSQSLAASGGTPPYAWSVTVGSLPAGLTLSPAGTISGTPGVAGASTFSVKVIDNASASKTASLSLTINPAPLVITTSSLAAGTANTAYSQSLTASGGTPPYAWSVTVGSLPAGLTLSPAGAISGTPGAAGTSTFTVKVTDNSSAFTTAPLSLTINPAALVITTSSLPAGTANTAYSQSLATSGGTPPYSWSVTVGSLPAGLTLSPAGAISGTPGAAGTSTFTVKVTDNASASTTASLSITINPAALIITTTSLPGGTVGIPYSRTLTASGGTSQYSWSVVGGSLPTGLTLSAPGIISGSPTAAGTSTFTVKVTDSASASTTASLSLTINPPALTITTSSLPAGTANTAYSQTLAAAGGTPPYSWTLATGSLPAGLTLSTAGTISGSPGTAGASTFTVKVTDSASASTTASLTLTINPPALTITTSSLPAGTANSAYSQTLAAAGGTPPYSWSLATGSLPAGLTLSAPGIISGSPTAAGASSFTVKVTDSASLSTTAPLSITITPPALTITTSSLLAGTANTAYSQTLAAAGGTPPYAWSLATGSLPAGLTLSTAGTISGTPSAAGASTFTVKVTDSASTSTTASLSLTINPPALTITTSTLPAGIVNTAYSQTLAAAGGTPPYTWSLVTGSLPAGVTLSTAGTISGTPSAAGASTFTVKVTDSASASTTASLSLTINPPALTITTSSLPAGTANTAYSQTLAAAGGTPPYSWTLASGSLPTGLTFSAVGVLSGTPDTAGSTSFSVKVTDSASASTTAALSLTINPATLTITTATLPAGTANAAYSQTLAAAGGTPPYTWSLASGSLPTGLTLSAAGVLSGTPGAAGASNFTVKVTDSASGSTTVALSLTINPATLTITTAALPSGTVSIAYSQTLAAAGGTPPYTWSLNSGSLPSGLGLSPTGTISGTPSVSGNFGFSAQVTDNAGIKTARTFSIQIQASPIQINISSLPASTAGTSYTQTLTASGGIPPFSWSLNSGLLPPGLTLDTAGTIRGAATTAGTYTFSIRVADASGANATMGYAITVNGPVTIQTSSLADALIGSLYSQQLRTAGGTPPYVWSVKSGALPDGIKLDAASGLLSGTPSLVGTFTFTLRAVDNVSAFADRQFQITTAAGLILTTAPVLGAATVGLPFSQQLDAAGGKPPYLWSISSGGLPAGISLGTTTGALSGVPSVAGSFQFTVDVTDGLGRKASKPFSLVVASALGISSAPALPAAIAGVSYSQTLAATGGTSPYLWSITAGGLPPGLSFDAGTAIISGTPTLGGSFAFTVQVTDTNSVQASKQFTLSVTSNLTITTASPLPDATVGSPYSRSLTVTGGVPPYVWTAKAGSLPPGLAIDPLSSTIVGTPSVNGSFAFTLQVTDAGGGTAIHDYALTVSLPTLPSVSIDGLTDPGNAADQPSFTVSLATSYPVQLTGQVVIAFAPDPVAGIDDTSIQFATGGRTVNFTIPAGRTNAVFSTSQMAFQTGTVAGTISLNLALQSAKSEVTTTATRTLQIPLTAPGARSLQVVHTSGGFELHISGYSTPRQLTQLLVQLSPSAGSDLQTTQLTIPLTDPAANWYQSAASRPFGSQFVLVLPFTIQGNAAGIDSVGVSLVNSQGSSPMLTSKY